MDPTKLLPNLPDWISIPVAIMMVVLHLGSSLKPVFLNMGVQSKAVRRKKEELELLKVQHELTEIKTKLGMPVAEEASELIEKIRSTEASTEPEAQEEVVLSRPKRFLYGMAGTLVPSILEILFVNFDFFTESTVDENIEVVLRIMVFTIIGGLVCTFLTRRTCSRQVCFMSGMCMAVLFSVLIR